MCNLVSWFVEVLSCGFVQLLISNIPSMLSKSHCQCFLCFTNILMFTLLTGEAVDYVWCLTIYLVFNVMLVTGCSRFECKYMHMQAHPADSNGSASPKITESAWYFSSLQGYGYWLSTCLFDDRFWNLLSLARLVFHPAGISPMGIIVLFCFWWDFQPLGSCCLGCHPSDFVLIIFVQTQPKHKQVHLADSNGSASP